MLTAYPDYSRTKNRKTVELRELREFHGFLVRVSRFVCNVLLIEKNINGVARSSPRQRRSPTPHLTVRISCEKEKSRTVNTVLDFGPSVEIRTRGLLNPIYIEDIPYCINSRQI